MRRWDDSYRADLQGRLTEAAVRAARALEAMAGRVVPALDDLAIGSARSLRGAVLFFDISAFSGRVGVDADTQRSALQTLSIVIPTMMGIVYDHDGYVEKNTGDGVMGVIRLGSPDADIAEAALACARTMMYALHTLVNPRLVDLAIQPIDARIGIDLGPLHVGRIGVPGGSADHPRSFLTVVGAAANLASKIVEDHAAPGQVVVGDLVKRNAPEIRQRLMVDVSPDGWHPRRVLHYAAPADDRWEVAPDGQGVDEAAFC